MLAHDCDGVSAQASHSLARSHKSGQMATAEDSSDASDVFAAGGIDDDDDDGCADELGLLDRATFYCALPSPRGQYMH